jgi:hypothetical protein
MKLIFLKQIANTYTDTKFNFHDAMTKLAAVKHQEG